MRTTRSNNDTICLFVKDTDDGCFVSTPDGEMNTRNMGGYNEPFYLKDGTEIFYPSWADW